MSAIIKQLEKMKIELQKSMVLIDRYLDAERPDAIHHKFFKALFKLKLFKAMISNKNNNVFDMKVIDGILYVPTKSGVLRDFLALKGFDKYDKIAKTLKLSNAWIGNESSRIPGRHFYCLKFNLKLLIKIYK